MTPLKTIRLLYLIFSFREVLVPLCFFLTTATLLASLIRERDDGVSTCVDLRVQRGAPKHLASGFIYEIPDAFGQIPDHSHTNIGFNYGRADCVQGKVSCSWIDLWHGELPRSSQFDFDQLQDVPSISREVHHPTSRSFRCRQRELVHGLARE